MFAGAFSPWSSRQGLLTDWSCTCWCQWGPMLLALPCKDAFFKITIKLQSKLCHKCDGCLLKSNLLLFKDLCIYVKVLVRGRGRVNFHTCWFIVQMVEFPGVRLGWSQAPPAFLGLPHEYQGPSYTALPSVCSGIWLRNGAARTSTVTRIGCRYCCGCLYMLCFSPAPWLQFLHFTERWLCCQIIY